MITDGKMKAGLVQALVTIETELGTDCPVSFIEVLMRIPRTGEISISELRKMTPMSSGGMSRLIAMMAGHKKEGRRNVPTFISLRDDPADRRYSLVSLTEEGRSFVDRVVSQLSFYIKQEV
jgi:DNA-binding MarR family transcriptional regulator